MVVVMMMIRIIIITNAKSTRCLISSLAMDADVGQMQLLEGWGLQTYKVVGTYDGAVWLHILS